MNQARYLEMVQPWFLEMVQVWSILEMHQGWWHLEVGPAKCLEVDQPIHFKAAGHVVRHAIDQGHAVAEPSCCLWAQSKVTFAPQALVFII